MGCASSIQTADHLEGRTADAPRVDHPLALKDSIVVEDCHSLMAEEDGRLREQHKKVQKLRQSQDFMKNSVEASQCVNDAIMSLVSNPLLQDHAYHKLLGINKKLVTKKQNRVNYLAKKSQKAELQLKKEQQRGMIRSQSQMIRGIRQAGKENRTMVQRLTQPVFASRFDWGIEA